MDEYILLAFLASFVLILAGLFWLGNAAENESRREDWRVIYHDNARTRRVRKSEAQSLAAIFGGCVVYDPWKPQE